MQNEGKLTFGLAMSGSGNRTSFYVGFLEETDAAGLKFDYLSACSGGSLVAAAYACGGLSQLKAFMMDFNSEKLKSLIKRTSLKNGGLFSLDLAEEELLKITKGKTFEEVSPKMSFAAVDIESGELVYLCMGDIARAALISCTLPGIFEAVKWGERTLVDGGLLVMVPSQPIKLAKVDVCVGINMRGTRHIFTEGQMTLKKAFNFFKKILLIEYLENLFEYLFLDKEADISKHPHFFTVLGKSMDLAIKASKNESTQQPECDLLITPEMPKLKNKEFDHASVMEYYELGKKTAREYAPKIKEILKQKSR